MEKTSNLHLKEVVVVVWASNSNASRKPLLWKYSRHGHLGGDCDQTQNTLERLLFISCLAWGHLKSPQELQDGAAEKDISLPRARPGSSAERMAVQADIYIHCALEYISNCR